MARRDGRPDQGGRGTPRRPACPAPAPAVRELPGWAADAAERSSIGAAVCDDVQLAAGHQPARAAALVCDAPARARRRPAGYPGDARACTAQHHAALHARERGTAHRGLPESPPASEAPARLTLLSAWRDFHPPVLLSSVKVVARTLPAALVGPRLRDETDG